MARRDPCEQCGTPGLWPRTACQTCEWSRTVITQARWAVLQLPRMYEASLRVEALDRFDRLVAVQGFSPGDALRPEQALRLMQAGETLVGRAKCRAGDVRLPDPSLQSHLEVRGLTPEQIRTTVGAGLEAALG